MKSQCDQTYMNSLYTTSCLVMRLATDQQYCSNGSNIILCTYIWYSASPEEIELFCVASFICPIMRSPLTERKNTNTRQIHTYRFINNFIVVGLKWYSSSLDSVAITVQWETFEGENFCEFRGFVAIRKSFSVKYWGMAFIGMANESSPRKFSP